MPLLVPPGVVTTICTVPAPAGATAVILAAETVVKEVAGTPPKVTEDTVTNPLPFSVTVVRARPVEGVLTVMMGTTRAASGCAPVDDEMFGISTVILLNGRVISGPGRRGVPGHWAVSCAVGNRPTRPWALVC